MPNINDKLESAFKAAISNTDQKSYKDSLFDQGIDGALPHLTQYSFTNKIQDLKGQTFNQYEILDKIGSGGMGDVYLAKRNDGQYEKNVAIKILSKGYLTADIKNRFLREKQILAELRHPGIVPLVDAGTTEDQVPWFALEYIDGLPIHQFCEQQKSTFEAAVQLMLKVCDAVQFAHSQGVVHRDLKPANILVETIEGEFHPIILDFGIAQKHNATHLTSQGHIIGTPSYMSPEQITGNTKLLDRRTDVFSLGVVLYRLLVGKLPFVAESAVATYEKIMHQSLDKIKSSVPGFPRDLQIILETSMKKQPADRYQSVNDFKTDLQNWLSGFPIKAQKENLMVRFFSWMKRHKLATTLSMVLVVTSAMLLVKYAYDINTERQLAFESKQESDELLNFMLEDLHQQLTEIGRVDLLETVAERSLSHLNKYQRILSSDQYLKQATIYRNIAEVLTMQSNITQSETALLNAKNLLLKLLKDPNNQDKTLAALSATYVDLADLHAKFGNLAKASIEYNEALTYAYQMRSIDGSDQQKITQWLVHNSFAWNLMEQNQFDNALAQLQQALAITDQQLSLHNNQTEWKQRKLKTLTTYGWYYNSLRALKSSQKVYLEALVLAEELYQDNPNSTPTINGLQRVLNQLAYTYAVDKDFQAAITYAEQAKAKGIALHNQVPENRIYYRALAYTYTTLGDSYKSTGQLMLAEENFSAGLAITEQIALSSPDNASLQNDLAIDNMNFGQLLFERGDTKEAKLHWFKAEQAIVTFASQANASIYYIDTYATVLLMQGKIKQAHPYLLQLKYSEGWGQTTFQALKETYNLTTYDSNE